MHQARVPRSDDRLRILCVLPTLNPYGGVVSVINKLNILTDWGHRVTLVSLSRISHDVVHPKSEPAYVEDWTAIPNAAGTDYDILLATSWETVEPVVEIERRANGARAFYFVQDFEVSFYDSDDVGVRTKVLATYEQIPRRIVKTDYLSGVLAAQGWESMRIPPGMDLDAFYPRDQPRQPRVLGMARPHTPNDHRGYQPLIGSFRELQRRRPEVEVAFFGSDELPDVDFPHINLGRLAPDNLPDAYSSASVFVDTSLQHGFGRTGVEAMACATPCVLSDSGGISEYAVPEVNALIVPVNDTAATVAAIERILDDPNLAGHLAQAGLHAVSKYSDYGATEAMLRIFRAID